MKAVFLGLAILVSPSIVGCGDTADAASTHEGVVVQITETLGDMLDVMDSATDDASTEAAKVKMEEIGRRFEMLSRRLEELGEPDAIITERMAAEMAAAVQGVSARMSQIVMRAASDPHLQELLQAMSGAMDSLPDLGK